MNAETFISLDQDSYSADNNEEGHSNELRSNSGDAKANEIELDQGHRQIVQKAKEIMKEVKTTEGIRFMKVKKRMFFPSQKN